MNRALVILPALLCLPGVVAHAETTGLVAEFRFDDGQGAIAVDTSRLGHTGRVHEADWVPGRFGTALSFRAPDAAVRVGRRRHLNLHRALTIEAWVYPTVSDDQSRIIVAKNDE